MRSCVITVSPAMTDDTFAYLVKRVRARFGEDADCVRVNDADVLGGFQIEFDGAVYDNTVKTRLDQARDVFSRGGGSV